LPSGKEPPDIHWNGSWAGHRSGLDDVERRKESYAVDKVLNRLRYKCFITFS
jgi:hypothetical protein